MTLDLLLKPEPADDPHAALAAKALAYPYAPPDQSFLFETADPQVRRIEATSVRVHPSRAAGDARLYDIDVAVAGEARPRRFERRVAVIAAGSNASHARLTTKYGEAGESACFPVLKARVKGLAAAYSAHVSVYGAIPGTLVRDEQAVSHLHVAFLNRAELARLNATEGLGMNYGLAALADIDAAIGEGVRLHGVLAYVSRRGAFAPDRGPVRVSAFKAERSALAPMSQAEIMTRLQHYLGEAETPVGAFIAAHVMDERRRRQRMEAMRPAARPCDLPGLHWIEGGLQEAPSALLPEGLI